MLSLLIDHHIRILALSFYDWKVSISISYFPNHLLLAVKFDLPQYLCLCRMGPRLHLLQWLSNMSRLSHS